MFGTRQTQSARRQFAAAFIGLMMLAASHVQAQQAPPAEGDSAQLVEVLKSADAPLFDKAKACQRLAVIGTPESIDVLSGLLSDDQLAHYARYALEPMPYPAVDEALRAAAGNLSGKLLVGVVNTIGWRRDDGAVTLLKPLVDNDDTTIAAAAIAALGRIASDEALEILQATLGTDVVPPAIVGDAWLTAAEMSIDDGKTDQAISLYDALREADVPRHVQTAALLGAIRARGAAGMELLVEQLAAEPQDRFRVGLQLAQEIGGPQVHEMLISKLKALPPLRQSLVIYVLGNLGEKSSLPVVADAAASGEDDVRIAAIRVLADIGDATSVAVLIDAATGDEEALSQAARGSLADLPGEDVDAALAGLLAGSQGAKRLLVIHLIGQRSISSAVPALIKAAEETDAEIRAAAITSLGLTVDQKQLDVLIDKVVQPKSEDDGAVARQALEKAVLRMPDRDACAEVLLERMPNASIAAQGELLSLLGVLGGDRALQGVVSAARDGSDVQQDAATRVLGEWVGPEAAPALLELAKSGSEKYKIRCLRGYIRIIRQFGGLPAGDRLAMCREAMEVATRDDEKRLILDALTRIPSPASLQMAANQLETPGLSEAAAIAAVSIGEKVLPTQPALVAEVMPKVVAVAKDDEVIAQAKRLIRRAKN